MSVSKADRERILKRIETVREYQGLGLEAASKGVGVQLRTWERWRKRESVGYMNKLPEISKVLGVSIGELTADTELSAGSVALDTLLLQGISRQVSEIHAMLSRGVEG